MTLSQGWFIAAWVLLFGDGLWSGLGAIGAFCIALYADYKETEKEIDAMCRKQHQEGGDAL